MRLYKTKFIDDDSKTGVHKAIWSGSQAEASKDRVRLKKDGMREIITEETDVPTTKAELITFLSALTMGAE